MISEAAILQNGMFPFVCFCFRCCRWPPDLNLNTQPPDTSPLLRRLGLACESLVFGQRKRFMRLIVCLSAVWLKRPLSEWSPQRPPAGFVWSRQEVSAFINGNRSRREGGGTAEGRFKGLPEKSGGDFWFLSVITLLISDTHSSYSSAS